MRSWGGLLKTLRSLHLCSLNSPVDSFSFIIEVNMSQQFTVKTYNLADLFCLLLVSPHTVATPPAVLLFNIPARLLPEGLCIRYEFLPSVVSPQKSDSFHPSPFYGLLQSPCLSETLPSISPPRLPSLYLCCIFFLHSPPLHLAYVFYLLNIVPKRMLIITEAGSVLFRYP